MNNDLISRSALKKAFEETVCIEPMPYAFVKQIIDNAPAVEPETKVVANVTFNKEQLEEIVEKAKADILAQFERPQGEWIDYDNTFYKCPDCGYLLEKCCPQCQNKVILPKGGAE